MGERGDSIYLTNTYSHIFTVLCQLVKTVNLDLYPTIEFFCAMACEAPYQQPTKAWHEQG